MSSNITPAFHYVTAEKAFKLPNSKGKKQSRLHIYEYSGVKGQDPTAVAAKLLKKKSEKKLGRLEKKYFVLYKHETTDGQETWYKINKKSLEKRLNIDIESMPTDKNGLVDSALLLDAINQKKPSNDNPVDEPKWNPDWNSRSGKTVGALGSQWTFPSDHIPIGGVIKAGDVRLQVATFNVLNSAYIGHITNGDSQGLNGSAITQKNIPSGTNGLTQRDMETLQQVKDLLSHTDFLALQECSHAFELELKKDNNLKIISSGNGVDRQLYIYKKFKLTPVGTPKYETVGNESYKKITEILFQDKNGQEYAFVGVHLAGGPNGNAARKQLATYLANHYDPNRITVVLGDMNAKTSDVGQAIEAAFEENPFHHLTQGSPTHINTKQEAQDYDSIHIAAPSGVTYNERKPNSLLAGLDTHSNLLT